MIEFFKEVYLYKIVLLTGSTGFKGTWLALWLKKLGAEVIGYALSPPTQPNLFEALSLDREILQIYGDIRNLDKLRSVCDKHRPSIVFHLAAQPIVRLSYQEPHYTFDTNVLGTVTILEAVRQSKSVHAVINITSDKCYENKEWVWTYRENDSLGGYDPYSNSKGCAELVTTSYLRSFFNPDTYGRLHTVGLASARAGNVIGGGDWGQDRLVPDFFRALAIGEPLVIRNPQAVRPWQHVLEPLAGYLLLGAKLASVGSRFSGPWNFGPLPGKIWTVEEVVKQLISLCGQGSYRVVEDTHRHESHWLQLDCSKALIELGWAAKIDLEKALELTVNWYKHFYSQGTGSKLLDMTIDQINVYEKIVDAVI